MGGAGDLYRINLDPQNQGGTLPGDVDTRGSIGGSDVGANPRDDQRVRDLVEEYMEQTQILQQINFLNLNPGGLTLLGGFGQEVQHDFTVDPNLASQQADSTLDLCSVTLLGHPILVEWSTVITVGWSTTAAAVENLVNMFIWAGINFDMSVNTAFNGSWVYWEQAQYQKVGARAYSVSVPLHGRTIFHPNWSGSAWVVNVNNILTAGVHNLTLSFSIGIGHSPITAGSVSVLIANSECLVYDIDATSLSKLSFPE